MNTFLTIGGCILGYLIIGLCWARSRAVGIQKFMNDEWERHPGLGLTCLEVRLVGHIFFWLFIVTFLLLGAIVNWTAAPIGRQRDRVGGLRARADEMAAMLEALPSEEDRRILAAVIAEDRKLAKELDL